MNKEKYEIYLSDFTSLDKEELQSKTGIFKRQIVDKTASEYKLSLTQIINKIHQGFCLNTGTVNHKRIFVLDIDNQDNNKIYYPDLLSLLEDFELYPAAIFETLSSTVEDPRYRILLIINQDIESESEYKDINKFLIDIINKFYPDCVDIKCSAPNSIFYPCSKLVYKDQNSIIDINVIKSLMNLYNRSNIKLDLINWIAPLFHMEKAITTKQLNNLILSSERFIIDLENVFNVIRSRRLASRTKTSTPAHLIQKRTLEDERSESVSSGARLAGLVLPEKIIKHRVYLGYNLLKKLKQLSIGRLFHLEENIYINDILGHTDESGNPFRGIIRYNNGFYYYLYHPDESEIYVKYDVFELLQEILGLKSQEKAIDLISRTCNINYRPIPILNVQHNMEQYARNFHKVLQTEYARKYFDHDNLVLYTVYEYLITKANQEIKKVKEPITAYRFVAFENDIREYMVQKNVFQSNIKQHLGNKIKLLAALGLIRLVPEDEYNGYFQEYLEKMRARYVNAKVHVVEIPHYNRNLFKIVDEVAKDLQLDNINTRTIKYRNFEVFDKDSGFGKIMNILINRIGNNEIVAVPELQEICRNKIWPSCNDQTIREKLSGSLSLLKTVLGFTISRENIVFKQYRKDAKILIPNSVIQKRSNEVNAG